MSADGAGDGGVKHAGIEPTGVAVEAEGAVLEAEDVAAERGSRRP